MIRILSILLLAGSIALVEDGLFVMDHSQKPSASLDGSELVMRIAVQKHDVPEAKRVILYDSQGSYEGRYTIQIDLTKAPEEGWMPILVLEDHVIMEVGVSRSELGPTLSFGTNDPKLASSFHTRIARLFRLSDSQVLDRRESKVEPGVPPEPPPAASVLESSENMNTKPKSEGPADSGGR